MAARADAVDTLPTIMSTLSFSNISRALELERSAFDCVSAEVIIIFLPSTCPPKSFAAICAASTAPGPSIAE